MKFFTTKKYFMHRFNFTTGFIILTLYNYGHKDRFTNWQDFIFFPIACFFLGILINSLSLVLCDMFCKDSDKMIEIINEAEKEK